MPQVQEAPESPVMCTPEHVGWQPPCAWGDMYHPADATQSHLADVELVQQCGLGRDVWEQSRA